MKETLIALFLLVSPALCTDMQNIRLFDLLNLPLTIQTDLDGLKAEPMGKGETQFSQSECGLIFVSDAENNIRLTHGKTVGESTHCLLQFVADKFATVLKDADAIHDPANAREFVKTAQLQMLSDPKSSYNQLVKTFCDADGTYYTDLTGQTRKCEGKSR